MLGCFVFRKANKIMLLLLLYCTLVSSHKLLFSPAIVDFHLLIACLQFIVCLGERVTKKKQKKKQANKYTCLFLPGMQWFICSDV